MAQTASVIVIDGPIERVFDLVTTTRYWPQWHPATVGVSGVTERPFGLGDQIGEQAQIGARLYEGTWTVAEYERPRRAVLHGASSRIMIRYIFEDRGDATLFRRELTYHPEDFSATGDPAAVERLMRQQSEQALAKLKALVEELL